MGGTKHCGRRSPWDQSKVAAREASTTGERWDQAREDLLAMESAASGSLTSRGGGPSTKTLPVGHTQRLPEIQALHRTKHFNCTWDTRRRVIEIYRVCYGKLRWRRWREA